MDADEIGHLNLEPGCRRLGKVEEGRKLPLVNGSSWPLREVRERPPLERNRQLRVIAPVRESAQFGEKRKHGQVANGGYSWTRSAHRCRSCVIDKRSSGSYACVLSVNHCRIGTLVQYSVLIYADILKSLAGPLAPCTKERFPRAGSAGVREPGRALQKEDALYPKARERPRAQIQQVRR